MPELITMGETMVAMIPDGLGLLRYKRQYSVRIAGAESNLAMGVRKLGHTAGWISKLGKDEFGQLIIREIQAEGVDCSQVIWDETYPTGLMFKQLESDDTSVFYYRNNSAASHLTPDDLDEKYFENCKILHLTGITPVLSDSCKETVLKAIEYAKEHNIKISFDPNIRKKLWAGKDFREVLKSILLQSDIVEIGLEEAQEVLGAESENEILEVLKAHNPEVIVALKKGGDGAIVMHKDERCEIPPYECNCVETIGAGDAFNAGFLSGILEEQPLEICGKMGAIAGAMATEVVGDVEDQPDAEQMRKRLNNQNKIYR